MSKFDEACLLISGENTLKSSNRFAWSELVEKYPGKWIIYTDVEIVNDERLFLCTVLEICDDDTRSDKKCLRSYAQDVVQLRIRLHHTIGQIRWIISPCYVLNVKQECGTGDLRESIGQHMVYQKC